jgi:hypothetical protein
MKAATPKDEILLLAKAISEELHLAIANYQVFAPNRSRSRPGATSYLSKRRNGSIRLSALDREKGGIFAKGRRAMYSTVDSDEACSSV